MTLKTRLVCDNPQKYPKNLHILPNENLKTIQTQDYKPPKMVPTPGLHPVYSKTLDIYM